MGANCCVAVKDKPLPSPLRFEVSTYRSSRNSPTWSFRWDNRTHIEDAMENAAQFAQQDIENAMLEIKSESPNETEIFSDSGSPSNAFQLQKWLKSPVRIGTAGKSRDVAQETPFTANNSSPKRMGHTSSKLAIASDSKLINAVALIPLSSASRADLSSSLSDSLPSNPTLTRKLFQSPGHELSQEISDSRIASLQSVDENSSAGARPSFVLSSCSNDFSIGGSHGGSSDAWSTRAFFELVASSNKERWSADSVNLTSCRSQRACSNPPDTPPHQKICKACSKRLTGHCVVAVLVCGHLYHSECLEKVTIETNRYDPPCPVCTHGEKSAIRLFEKAGMDIIKSCKGKMAETDALGDAQSDDGKGARKNLKIGTNSKCRSYRRSFLKQYFSLAKPSQSTSRGGPKMKKGFWEKYRRE
ncbi:uncharacterized protein LOC121971930 isoform X1 [Zingiber officinale]|uniref:RING-type domain-containing protein n=1 Tax=Zingiber officinale TaxID=94328 RepID=A0A8J5LGE5_ZINOF|nr:uncharacterized protein LOC121971930 isoform X1 [Zingiber officinale]XP_042379393.1 uncharacterized protein LOC121971930 isoform X1 [Zingiber officinale]XP_042379394.1 uncharacterized protein LOC121971930 isoform X1 [Zingiber officinale]XP_042379395.1 uncharacterized protein LOC121971930 isoform X1 [Zingiber officinale]KAG6516544.1 hypothetical protein ZIOFF_027009 [Zingiber officinale]